MDFVDATQLATRLMGDAIATNLFMLGFAYQKGHVPVSADALLQAIEINGVAIQANQTAFGWGRKAALDLPAVTRTAMPAQPVLIQRPQKLEALLVDRTAFLTAYQDAAYARRYRSLVERVRAAEQQHRKSEVLATAVASSLFKLMAYKDEYEVARLYTDRRFKERLEKEFDGKPRLRFNLAPPVFNRRDAHGNPVKQSYGPWMLHVFRVLAPLRFLRGTRFDPFGGTEERCQERALANDYRQWVEQLLLRLGEADFEVALLLAKLPEQIRGFGHVKQASIAAAGIRRDALMEKLYAKAPRPLGSPVYV